MTTSVNGAATPAAPLAAPPILDAHMVSVDYGQGPVLDGVSLRWDSPTSTAIVGQSGSGKTTLLFALAGLEELACGTVHLLGTDTSSAGPDALARLRLRNIGFVFQQADLVPELTLRANIELPLRLLRWRSREVAARTDELLTRLDVASCASRRPNQVSGGQRQRAAIGRALAARPRIVFADEPTGALDSQNGDLAMDLLTTQCEHDNALLICVTHDENVANRCRRLVRISDGRVIADSAAPERTR